MLLIIRHLSHDKYSAIRRKIVERSPDLTEAQLKELQTKEFGELSE